MGAECTKLTAHKKNPVRQVRKPKKTFIDQVGDTESDLSGDDSIADEEFIPDARDARDFFDDLEEDLLSQEENRGLILETIQEKRQLEDLAEEASASVDSKSARSSDTPTASRAVSQADTTPPLATPSAASARQAPHLSSEEYYDPHPSLLKVGDGVYQVPGKNKSYLVKPHQNICIGKKKTAMKISSN